MRALLFASVFSILLLVCAVRGADRSVIGIRLLVPGQDPDASYIRFGSEDEYRAAPDELVSVPVLIYRGSTLKRTVYVWLEDGSGKRISSKEKFSLPERFMHYNLSANLTIDSCVSEDYLHLVAEGLGINVSKKVRILSDCSSDEQTAGDGEEVRFSVVDVMGSVVSGEQFRTRVVAFNPSSVDLEFDAWSYVYRSSKSYSGDREQNMKTLNLPEHSNVTFDLVNTVAAPEGDYLLKVKMLRSDRKTPVEFTFEIHVSGDRSSEEENSISAEKLSADGPIGEGYAALSETDIGVGGQEKRTLSVSNLSGGEGVSGAEGSAGTVYRSASSRAWSIAVYFLIALLSLLLVALVLKRF